MCIYMCACHVYTHVHTMQVIDVQFGLPGTTEPMNACLTGTRACSTGPSEKKAENYYF